MQAVLREFSQLIDEVVAFGTHALCWSLHVTTRGTDENAPRWTLFRRLLELLDGLGALLERGSGQTARVALRAAFECGLNIQYLLDADQTRRAFAYLVAGVHADIRFLKACDPSSPEGKQRKAIFSKDRFCANLGVVPASVVSSELAIRTSLLAKGEYANAEAEYQRVEGAGQKNPAWHSLYGGPRNVIDLAGHLGMGGLYELIYRPLSGATHSSDSVKQALASGDEGNAAILQLRLPADAQFITQTAVGLALDLFQKYIEFYVPERGGDFRAWYLTIRDAFLRLSGPPRINIKWK